MLSLQQALALYLQVDRARHTNLNYQRCLSPFVTDIGPGRNITLVTYADLLDYTARLHSTVQQSSFKQYVTIIKGFFNWCVSTRLLEHSPAAQLTARKPPRYREDERAMPEEVFAEALRRAWPKPRDYAVLSFFQGTACRAGGIASLRLPNLNIANMRAWIENKGGDFYWVYFGEMTAAALDRYLDVRPEVQHDHVFVSHRHPDVPLSASRYSDIVARYTDMRYRAHSIRHMITQRWDEQGVPLTELRDKLNHVSASTTNAYLRRGDARVQQLSRALDQPSDAPRRAKIIILDTG
ncbi:MAG: site-specific integrase [Anaerolineae bacterium]|nr:site-specific integrase [Anaerolineae bacterium]